MVQGLADILRPGWVGLDLADISALLAAQGDILVGLGEAAGP